MFKTVARHALFSKREAHFIRNPREAKHGASIQIFPRNIAMITFPVSRFPVPELSDLPDDVAARITDVQENAGFVPKSRTQN